MTVLRQYDPQGCLCGCGGECDEQGIPLNWEKCRTCDGEGKVWSRQKVGVVQAIADAPTVTCEDCQGHGSLKAAALAYFSLSLPRNAAKYYKRGADGATGFKWGHPEWRCESCAHPKSDGVWEGPAVELLDDPEHFFSEALAIEEWIKVKIGESTIRHNVEYRSSCDDKCKHGGAKVKPGTPFSEDNYKTSWRHVDVRPLGWPSDLRPEKLAMLCTRCYAARINMQKPDSDTLAA